VFGGGLSGSGLSGSGSGLDFGGAVQLGVQLFGWLLRRSVYTDGAVDLWFGNQDVPTHLGLPYRATQAQIDVLWDRYRLGRVATSTDGNCVFDALRLTVPRQWLQAGLQAALGGGVDPSDGPATIRRMRQ